jgi:hypothetical protein
MIIYTVIKSTWHKIVTLLCHPTLRLVILILLALFGIASIGIWVDFINRPQAPEPVPYCFINKAGDYHCPIITECLDNDGCVAHPHSPLSQHTWCLFGNDITPAACYDSQWLRKSLNPARLTTPVE